MPTASAGSDPGTAVPHAGWARAATGIVLAVTLWRVLGLALDRTDLFVDETQYWLWGQALDFGYYSKPPLIAWVIRAVTDLAGSDAAFWVRLPAPLFHAATALVLAASAARLWGRRAALWVAATYVTLPFTAVGSALISTDTVMAPFFAGTLYFYLRLTETRLVRFAAATGISLGIAFLGKYAALYGLVGIAFSSLLFPAARPGWRSALCLLAAFAVVISPNVAWNITHGLTTVRHTIDNTGWMNGSSSDQDSDIYDMIAFLAAQLVVAGPVYFLALVAAMVRRPAAPGWLIAFAAPVLVIVCVQALLDKAYANWGISAYFAGTLIVVPFLLAKAPRLLPLSVAVNAAVCVLVPVLTAFAPVLSFGGAHPLLSRYLGRADMSRTIIATAAAQGLATVVSADRDILADLFYTGRESGLAFRAPPPAGRPRNFYEQVHALGPNDTGPVLAVMQSPPTCGGRNAIPVATFDTRGGAYARRSYAAYVIEVSCVRP